MSYLLVGGCSWSHLEYKATSPEDDVSFPKWSEHLAEYLDVMLVSVARSGSGNFFQYSQLMEYILSDNPPKYLCWQLSEAGRRHIDGGKGFIKLPYQSIYNKDNHHYQTLDELVKDLKDYSQGIHLSAAQKTKIKHAYDEFYALDNKPLLLIDENFKRIYQIKKLCEMMGIKFFIFCSDVPFYSLAHENPNIEIYNSLKLFINLSRYRSNKNIDDVDPLAVYHNIIAMKSFKKIDKNSKGIYGWPFYEEFGGNYIDVVHNREKNSGGKYLWDYTISKDDIHPNGAGHLKLFNKLLPLLQKEWDI